MQHLKCRTCSTRNCAECERIVFSEDSRFHTCPDDNCRRVLKRPGQCVWGGDKPAMCIVIHTCQQEDVLVSGVMPFDSEFIWQSFLAGTKQLYDDDDLIWLRCCKFFDSLANLVHLILFPIEHIRDIIKRQLQAFWNIDDLVQHLETFWYEILQDTIQ